MVLKFESPSKIKAIHTLLKPSIAVLFDITYNTYNTYNKSFFFINSLMTRSLRALVSQQLCLAFDFNQNSSFISNDYFF